jgi:hypothetical protein
VTRSRDLATARVVLDEHAMASKQYQLTWDDAMLILCCWFLLLWLILGGG